MNCAIDNGGRCHGSGLAEGAKSGLSGILVRACKLRNRAFTLIEVLVVIGVIALLATLVVGLSSRAGRASRENRIRAEMTQLVTAIESYKEAIGQYPPDHYDPFARQVNTVSNALFYELTGVVVERLSDSNFEYRTPDRSETIRPVTVQQFFGVEGFANASMEPGSVRSFVEFKDKQYGEISSRPDVEVLVVPVAWPLSRTADQPTPVPGLNPWRYVSTNPTNNPNSFDLWAEWVDGKEIKIICNWNKDVLTVNRP